MKILLPAMAISSRVSRQSAAKPGQITSSPMVPARPASSEELRGLEPDPRFASESRLEADVDPVRIDFEAFGQQCCRGPALLFVGVAGGDVAFGEAVEAHQQPRRLALLVPQGVEAGGQRTDVAGVIVVSVDRTQFGDAPPRCEFVENGVEGGSRGRRRILRIERKHQEPAAAAAAENSQGGGDRGFAVSHPGEDRDHPADPIAELPLEIGRLVAPGCNQRRSIRGPDLAVRAGRPQRSKGEDEESFGSTTNENGAARRPWGRRGTAADRFVRRPPSRLPGNRG